MQRRQVKRIFCESQRIGTILLSWKPKISLGYTHYVYRRGLEDFGGFENFLEERGVIKHFGHGKGY